MAYTWDPDVYKLVVHNTEGEKYPLSMRLFEVNALQNYDDCVCTRDWFDGLGLPADVLLHNHFKGEPERHISVEDAILDVVPRINILDPRGAQREGVPYVCARTGNTRVFGALWCDLRNAFGLEITPQKIAEGFGIKNFRCLFPEIKYPEKRGGKICVPIDLLPEIMQLSVTRNRTEKDAVAFRLAVRIHRDVLANSVRLGISGPNLARLAILNEKFEQMLQLRATTVSKLVTDVNRMDIRLEANQHVVDAGARERRDLARRLTRIEEENVRLRAQLAHAYDTLSTYGGAIAILGGLSKPRMVQRLPGCTIASCSKRKRMSMDEWRHTFDIMTRLSGVPAPDAERIDTAYRDYVGATRSDDPPSPIWHALFQVVRDHTGEPNPSFEAMLAAAEDLREKSTPARKRICRPRRRKS